MAPFQQERKKLGKNEWKHQVSLNEDETTKSRTKFTMNTMETEMLNNGINLSKFMSVFDTLFINIPIYVCYRNKLPTPLQWILNF